MTDDLRQRLAEFEKYVWTHTTDAFQMQFDAVTDLGAASLSALADLAARVGGGASEEDVAARIRLDVSTLGTEHLAKIIQITGLTRNKLTTDLDSVLHAAGQRVSVPTWNNLPGRPQLWELASRELATRLRTIFLQTGCLDAAAAVGIIKSLNAATWPGYIRQERAKRGGHEAEGRLARVAHQLGVSFEPEVKAENAMSGDVRIQDVSFDLVFPDVERPNVVMKSTVHTANIGQYGESKDSLEMAEARTLVNRLPTRPVLLALADGLGFRSNRAGLEGVLTSSTEFCQFRTLWKGLVVAAGREGRSDLRLYLPADDRRFFGSFLERYGFAGYLLNEAPEAGTQAGDGVFVRA
jgi:hypothetical protein